MKREPNRTIEQNSLMWQMLSEWAQQEDRRTLDGHKLDDHDFKELLMADFLKDTGRLAEGLNGGVVYLSRSTSRLPKARMVEFITHIEAEGLRRGIVFRHAPPDQAKEPVIIERIAKSAKQKLTRAEVMAKARAAKANKKAAYKPNAVIVSLPTSKEEVASRLPCTAEGYVTYAEAQIISGRKKGIDKSITENWFLSQEQARLRQDCKVGDLATKLLHSLIKELT